MSNELSKPSADFFAPGALVGNPVDETGFSRSSVDGLSCSTAREKRPKGMSRADYIDARPGRNTLMFVDNAGIRRHARRKTWIFLVSVAAVAVVGALLMLNG